MGSIANLLKTRPPGPKPALGAFPEMETGDEWKKKKIQARFHNNPCEALRSISADFHEGAAILRGRVHSFYQKQLAQEAVRGVDGVGMIVNVVEVVPEPPAPTAEDPAE
jgi:osmotically-inducible protein OsmY